MDLNEYQSIVKFKKRVKFSIGDGVLFWAYNKWQPSWGCCQILKIQKNNLISIGSKEGIEICCITENRICWFQNCTPDNIQECANIQLDTVNNYVSNIQEIMFHMINLSTKKIIILRIDCLHVLKMYFMISVEDLF